MRIAIKSLTHPLDAPRPALWIRASLQRRDRTRWGRSWILPLPAFVRRLGGRHGPPGPDLRSEGKDREPRSAAPPASMHGENPVGAFLFLVAVVLLAWLWLVMVTPL